jgi:hypothetical protein
MKKKMKNKFTKRPVPSLATARDHSRANARETSVERLVERGKRCARLVVVQFEKRSVSGHAFRRAATGRNAEPALAAAAEAASSHHVGGIAEAKP